MQEFQDQTMDQSPPDESLREQMGARVREAADRVTFHRIELERHERIGRAAAAALHALESCSPVAKQVPEDFLSDAEPQQAAYR